MIPVLTDAEVARFQAKIQQGDGCHLWLAETNNRGYGRFAIYRSGRRIRLLAHRLSYALANGAIAAGSVIRHDCDTPACCNPGHLLAGSQLDNIRDAVWRGRHRAEGLQRGHDLLQDSLRRALECKEKLCPACATVKPFAAFHRNRTGPDGLQGWCKQCRSEKLRAAWRNDPEFRAREVARKRQRRAA
jgi:HNH endonuclease